MAAETQKNHKNLIYSKKMDFSEKYKTASNVSEQIPACSLINSKNFFFSKIFL